MSFEEDTPMSFEEYAKWVERLARKDKGWLEKALREHYRGMEDEVEQARRLGASKYGKSNHRRSVEDYQESLIKKFTLESGDQEYLVKKDVLLTAKDIENLGHSKDGKIVITIELTRSKFAEEIDPPSEQIDPRTIAWIKPYTYSPRHEIGVVILFHNGEFRTYTQNFKYFKHKFQQIVGNMVLVGGELPRLPWWNEG